MSSAEFFDELIEIDYGSDSDVSIDIDNSDKENKGSTNKVKLKKNQLAKISTAMTNEDSLNRNELNEIWKRLTTELNDIGPPTFTMLQWRRKWTQYKYNKKRRSNNVDINLPGKVSIDLPSQNQALHSIEVSVISDGINCSSEVLENLNIIIPPIQASVISDGINVSSEVLENLNIIIPPIEASVVSDGINVSSEVLENLNIVKQNQAVIKEKLDHSNSLLQQIFGKF